MIVNAKNINELDIDQKVWVIGENFTARTATYLGVFILSGISPMPKHIIAQWDSEIFHKFPTKFDDLANEFFHPIVCTQQEDIQMCIRLAILNMIVHKNMMYLSEDGTKINLTEEQENDYLKYFGDEDSYFYQVPGEEDN